jgi:hypothetical protein
MAHRLGDPSKPTYESENDQKHDCTDRRAYDCRNQADADADAQSRQQPTTDQGADNADDDIADEAEAASSDKLSGEPAGDQTDQKYD